MLASIGPKVDLSKETLHLHQGCVCPVCERNTKSQRGAANHGRMLPWRVQGRKGREECDQATHSHGVGRMGQQTGQVSRHRKYKGCRVVKESHQASGAVECLESRRMNCDMQAGCKQTWRGRREPQKASAQVQ